MKLAFTLDSVSTHSRPKAAGSATKTAYAPAHVSTHSRPKAAGFPTHHWPFPIRMFQHTAARRRLVRWLSFLGAKVNVSTHSRPKAAGAFSIARLNSCSVSTHSRPKAAGPWFSIIKYEEKFQHTAARRRLAPVLSDTDCTSGVSTHSRPKAAGYRHFLAR